MIKDVLHGDMDYRHMLELLIAKYGYTPFAAEQINNRWKSMGKAARSPVFMIGAKY